MNYSCPNDFRYRGFWVSRYNIQNYLDVLVKQRSASKWSIGSRYYMDFSAGIVKSIIGAIADNDVEFDKSDTRMCRLLEELIVKGGYGVDGVYSEDAHRAMNSLCVMLGKNPEHHVLHDKTVTGRMGQVKSKIKSLFGFGKKRDAAPAAAPASQESRPAAPTSKKGVIYKLSATLGGLIMIGSGILLAPDNSTTQSDAAPTFKTISVADTTHTVTQEYSLKDSSIARPFAAPKTAAPRMAVRETAPRATQSAPVATDSVSVGLTRASKSSLDILLGAKKAAELCRRVESQIQAGIFAAPAGMSVERIAHAMTMSRIYEGRSVILDALNSQTKLSPAQQAAFVAHIAEIGDLGCGIQRRMAAKHNLTGHSKFDKASKSMQRVHVKNLKQLKQLRKMAHTR